MNLVQWPSQSDRVTIPNAFEARPYQVNLYNARAEGFNRGIAIWHRRSGKDKTLVAMSAKETQKRVGSYYYLYPTYAQGKKAIWDGMDKGGFPYMWHFPREIIQGRNETEMQLTLTNRSIFQIVGSDNYNSIMSTNSIGDVFSEYSLQDPAAWDFMLPILIENGGWAFFAFTPRGRNHGYRLLKNAQKYPKDWFVEILTVEDTGLEYLVDEAKKEGYSDEMIEQEFYCSFNAPQQGAYYGREMMQARKDNRVRFIPHDPNHRVHTFWDLGIHDYMCIWFAQFVGSEIHLINYYQNCNEGMRHYVEVLDERKKDRRYMYGEHWAPHDIEVRELSLEGLTRRQSAATLGIEFSVVPQIPLMEGIEAVRKILHRCFFDAALADLGLSCLESYHKQWNEKMEVYSNTPVHDQWSHGADAFRTLANAIGMGAGQNEGAMSGDDYMDILRRRGYNV